MSNWKTIWRNRKSEIGKNILDDLIKADGFDGGAGKINKQDWIEYTRWIGQKLGIKYGDSIFEIGCGAGAMLYDYYKNMRCSVSGIDFSHEQIKIAKNVMPDMDFQTMEAIDLSTKQQYDYVISMSCFEYFPNEDYTNKVLENMINKSKIAVAVLDSNDIEKKELAMKIRKGALSDGEYENKYNNLDHLFFSKQFFIEFSNSKGLEIEIFDQNINNYSNGNFRFNVILRK